MALLYSFDKRRPGIFLYWTKVQYTALPLFARKALAKGE